MIINIRRKRISTVLLFLLAITNTIVCFSPKNKTEGYHSYVFPDEHAYFKVLDLEEGTVYNISLFTDTYWQTDYLFSIHVNKRPTDRNALFIIDTPGIKGETTLFTPEKTNDYYLRVSNNYGSGFFDIYVWENQTGVNMILEPYEPPFNWKWVWIPAITVGSIILLSIILGALVYLAKSIKWDDFHMPRPHLRKPHIHFKLPRIRLPKINWNKIRIRRRKKGPPIKNSLFEKDEITILNPETEIRCMVTGLVLQFKDNNIIICPFCGNYAKKEALKDWLEIREICPVCKKSLQIHQCARVVIS